MAAIW